MKIEPKKSNYKHYALGVYNGAKLTLVVPSRWNHDAYPKYYIQYPHPTTPKLSTKVKETYLRCKEYFKTQEKLTKQDELDLLIVAFSYHINSLILPTLTNTNTESSITLNTNALAAVNAYFFMQQQQHEIDELSGISNYTNRNKTLNTFFNLPQNKSLRLKDLTVDVWSNFRIYLLTTPTPTKPKGLAKSSVNQYITYVKSFYNWLIIQQDLNIINHPLKLKKLDTSQQAKKFNEISNSELGDFFDKVDCDKYLRLHLICLLVLENTVRPVQVRDIQHKDIDLTSDSIKVYDRKSRKYRTIKFELKVKSLIEKIYMNTLNAGVIVTDSMYLIGGYNCFKENLPMSDKGLRVAQVKPFREEYPHLNHIQIYEMKHTSITKTSPGDLVGTQKRTGHARASTTQVYDRSESVSRAVTLEDLLSM
ncbi:phage integrase SAM-like domain-containing protein [Pedobacter sp. N36a]|uniref:phage integrase SAM-like domain-containing protein n=1 Tax=Pedobacter sp. N36a TaxID=2767996 RepID=UPI00165698DC|nr:phage integrase SAM-like domain-containing protein [Pedobacter sp. N36a]MBC8987548.1 phage integrase SAM-like domain-containing protein [Pedobacter sp. N36a]